MPKSIFLHILKGDNMRYIVMPNIGVARMEIPPNNKDNRYCNGIFTVFAYNPLITPFNVVQMICRSFLMSNYQIIDGPDNREDNPIEMYKRLSLPEYSKVVIPSLLPIRVTERDVMEEMTKTFGKINDAFETATNVVYDA